MFRFRAEPARLPVSSPLIFGSPLLILTIPPLILMSPMLIPGTPPALSEDTPEFALIPAEIQ